LVFRQLVDYLFCSPTIAISPNSAGLTLHYFDLGSQGPIIVIDIFLFFRVPCEGELELLLCD